MNLKNLAKTIVNIAGVVAGYGAVFAPLTKTTKDDELVKVASDSLLKLADAVTSVEVMGQELSIPGVDKARAAGPLAAQIVLRSLAVAGRELDTSKTDKFKTACATLSGAMADILDCFKN